MSIDNCTEIVVRETVLTTVKATLPNLLHLQHELIDCPSFGGKFTTITNWHSPSNIRCVTIPFASRVNKENLRIKLSLSTMCKLHLIMVIMRLDWTPSELTVIATVMKSRGTVGCCDNRKISLVYGTVRLL